MSAHTHGQSRGLPLVPCQTATPTITTTIEVPDGRRELAFETASVDTGSWAVFADYPTYVRWRYRGDAPTFAREMRVAEGTTGIGGDILYLGAHTTHERTVDGQRQVLVVPATAEGVAVTATLDALASARQRLATAPGAEPVYAIALPAGVETAAAGRADGNAFWVAADARRDGTTWVHEYLHTQQRFRHDDATVWFTEGSADHFADLYAYYDGRQSFEQFRAATTTDEDALVVLSALSAPRQGAYTKGQRVAAALDQRIRNATDGARSLRDVVARLNADGGELTNERIRLAAEAVAGGSLNSWFDTYVDGAAVPDLPATPSSYRPLTAVDTDGDGLTNLQETELGTDPRHTDADRDGLGDTREADGPTDPRLADTDDDGLPDGTEADGPTDPTVADTDGDGLADGTERDAGSDPTVADTDGDGLADGPERDAGTDPTTPDTDADGLPDAVEVDGPTDPTRADTDGDGLADDQETEGPTNPTVADTDGDGLTDGAERDGGSNPTRADTDGDGLADGAERDLGSDPTSADTDGDGFRDAREAAAGTDPTEATGLVDFWVARLFGLL
ncbi:hypothetical protein [Halosegnis sp.]|uniref:hypothetical protein n=1 Tax=Halosegnis sp. TaxID=2864959 RepID=UPI0035D3E7C1